jgi:hypothetical protein
MAAARLGEQARVTWGRLLEQLPASVDRRAGCDLVSQIPHPISAAA